MKLCSEDFFWFIKGKFYFKNTCIMVYSMSMMIFDQEKYEDVKKFSCRFIFIRVIGCLSRHTCLLEIFLKGTSKFKFTCKFLKLRNGEHDVLINQSTVLIYMAIWRQILTLKNHGVILNLKELIKPGYWTKILSLLSFSYHSAVVYHCWCYCLQYW